MKPETKGARQADQPTGKAPCRECGGLDFHILGCVFDKKPDTLTPVLDSERVASDAPEVFIGKRYEVRDKDDPRGLPRGVITINKLVRAYPNHEDDLYSYIGADGYEDQIQIKVLRYYFDPVIASGEGRRECVKWRERSLWK